MYQPLNPTTATAADCLRASSALVRRAGFHRYEGLKHLVIARGFNPADGRALVEFQTLQRLFHSAQMMRYAASEAGAKRAEWIARVNFREGAIAPAASQAA